ncbi:thioredoxin family protein [Chitinophaga nivalis]|uniref:Thioredoxin family protein n=1 Tax=Chitinophaga nivalis TaxID=2991709 RepID=A0ABT3IPQ3_9BACT|nr:thioredoxin family protein [Chitinophaga nivalis]MCW3464364.1 thioredoxin family protein [Chitinophaga nivalis]MCW3485945.1 thioredoxin family protein [Chitinophaga nivalis]
MNDSNTLKELERPVLLQFTATWCGPCRILSPIIDKVAQAANEVVDVRRIDIDQEQQLASDFLIRGVPTLVLLDKNGDIYWRHTGLLSEKEILRQIAGLP